MGRLAITAPLLLESGAMREREKLTHVKEKKNVNWGYTAIDFFSSFIEWRVCVQTDCWLNYTTTLYKVRLRGEIEKI